MVTTLMSGNTALSFCFVSKVRKHCVLRFIFRYPLLPFTSLLPLVFYVILLTFSSCNPAKYVPQGEYLLESVELKVDNKTIDNKQLKSHVRQKPNKQIVGARFHLWLYNSSKPDKKNRWNEFLRKNGEEPVIWQQSMTDRSKEQLDAYLETKGYYYADITDTVVLKRRKKRANVIYNIKTGWPYTVTKIDYSIPDTAIERLILTDTLNSLVKPGVLLDHDILRTERKRIETNLKNHGYYSFAEDFIAPEVDTTHLNRSARLRFIVQPHTERTADNRVVRMPYPLYHIRSLTVNASLSMLNLVETTNGRKTVSDTLTHGEVSYIIPKDFPVRASTIRNSVYIFPDSLYRLRDINQTYQHLLGLRNFKQVSVELSEAQEHAGLSMRDLDCSINLLPFTRQSYAPEIEYTYSEGHGGGVRLLYQNKSFFGHAEIFDLRLRGLAEAVATNETGVAYQTKMEYEAEATLNVPQFLLPFRSGRFTQKYSPKTAFSILYNYQRYPRYYTRTVFNTSFGYNWRGSEVVSHFVKPLDVNYVQLPSESISEAFQTTLNKYPYLKNSYQSHMVVSSSYTYVRDIRQINKDNSFFIRTNFETAGLLLNSIYKLSDPSKQLGHSYEMFGNRFSQFIKGDIDLRHYHTINGNNRVVARIFAGMGWPYGNSKTSVVDGAGVLKTVAAMPFEKKYYVGGANSIRGWRLRSLGPGSYEDPASVASYPNNTGDIKLEANLEYRFKLVGFFEGALFMDAGNVWDSHRDEDRPGADFSFDRFYREIAVSGGVGLRIDLKFLIFRSDLGMKLHDPAGNGRWAFTPKPDGSKRVDRNDFCLSIAVGYPFF